MKRCLVLVEGITEEAGYIERVIMNSPIASNYDEIVRAKTEEFFDKQTPWYLKWVENVKPLQESIDKFADLKVFFESHQGRIGACRTVRFLIQRMQQKGYEVSTLSHSLGTIITLTCGPNLRDEAITVKETMLYASPMGLAFPPLRDKVLNFTRRYMRNYGTEEKIKYVYGTKDIVSKNYSEDNQGQILDLTCSREETKKEIEAKAEGHSLAKLI